MTVTNGEQRSEIAKSAICPICSIRFTPTEWLHRRIKVINDRFYDIHENCWARNHRQEDQ